MPSHRSDSDEPNDYPDPREADGAVVLPIEDTLDLHTFSPKDISDLVREYLTACARRGLREVRVIHGRGTGTQRRVVRAILTGHPLVEAFADAPPERGGWGATVVQLREDPSSPPNDR